MAMSNSLHGNLQRQQSRSRKCEGLETAFMTARTRRSNRNGLNRTSGGTILGATSLSAVSFTIACNDLHDRTMKKKHVNHIRSYKALRGVGRSPQSPRLLCMVFVQIVSKTPANFYFLIVIDTVIPLLRR